MLFQLFPGCLRGSRDIAPPSTMPCALELARGRRRSFIATSRHCQDYRDGEILLRFDVWIFKKSIFESRDPIQRIVNLFLDKTGFAEGKRTDDTIILRQKGIKKWTRELFI